MRGQRESTIVPLFSYHCAQCDTDVELLRRIPDDVELIFGETAFEHPFVQIEQMMPFVPFVRCRNVDEAIPKRPVLASTASGTRLSSIPATWST